MATTREASEAKTDFVCLSGTKWSESVVRAIPADVVGAFVCLSVCPPPLYLSHFLMDFDNFFLNERK